MFWQIQFQTTCVGISISLFSRFSLSIFRENCFKPKYLHSTDAQSSTAHKRDIVMTKTVFVAQHSRLFEYITDALISLHWLRVLEQIIFKVATLMYRALHGSAPPYLASMMMMMVKLGTTTVTGLSIDSVLVSDGGCANVFVSGVLLRHIVEQ